MNKKVDSVEEKSIKETGLVPKENSKLTDTGNDLNILIDSIDNKLDNNKSMSVENESLLAQNSKGFDMTTDAEIETTDDDDERSANDAVTVEGIDKDKNFDIGQWYPPAISPRILDLLPAFQHQSNAFPPALLLHILSCLFWCGLW